MSAATCLDQCGRQAERRAAAETRAELARALDLPGVIPARYPGTCGGCGARFDAGEPILNTAARGYPAVWAGALCCTALDADLRAQM